MIAEFHPIARPSDSRNSQIMYPPRELDFDSFPPAVKRKVRVFLYLCTLLLLSSTVSSAIEIVWVIPHVTVARADPNFAYQSVDTLMNNTILPLTSVQSAVLLLARAT